jgi:hypothetical protein
MLVAHLGQVGKAARAGEQSALGGGAFARGPQRIRLRGMKGSAVGGVGLLGSRSK